MKRIMVVLVAALFLLIAVPVASAAASVSVDKTSVLPGETVTVSGTAAANESVIVKITDQEGNIVFFDAAKADSSGGYSVAFVVPADMKAGKLNVTAGSGSDVATTTITVAKPAATVRPTAAPTSTASPSATPSASPTAAPTSTASPGATPSANPTAAPTSTASPSATPSARATAAAGEDESGPPKTADEPDIVIPRKISEDKETGIIIVEIDIEDLPEGTVAIETPGGDILYISDAQDGVLIFEIAKDEVNASGQVELIALDDEMLPLSTLLVNVQSETGAPGMSIWLMIGIIAAGLILLVLIIIFWTKYRNTQTSDVTDMDI